MKKEQAVIDREYQNIRLNHEDVASFSDSPSRAKKDHRIVVVRKNLSIERGERVLFEEIRYFFYITNDLGVEASEIVYEANDRCNQERLIGQLKGGVRALHLSKTSAPETSEKHDKTTLRINACFEHATASLHPRANGLQLPHDVAENDCRSLVQGLEKVMIEC